MRYRSSFPVCVGSAEFETADVLAQTAALLRVAFLIVSAILHADIMIWSATGMKWIQSKCRSMGLLTEGTGRFEIAALVDDRAMITAIDKRGRPQSAKPLSVLWQVFEAHGWSERNTIMIDDVRHNFEMNMANGIVCKPFKNSRVLRDTDVELRRLAKYLTGIPHDADLSKIPHERRLREL